MGLVNKKWADGGNLNDAFGGLLSERERQREKGERNSTAAMGGGMGAFWGSRVMEIVKKHDSGGLVWKRIKLTSTRKANAKTRLRRVWQVLF